MQSFLCLSVMVAITCIFGCERKYCKEAGCDGWIKVSYDRPISGPYELRVSTAGLSVSARCPLSLASAQPVGTQQARLGCDADSFEVAVASGADGATRYGRHAADADPIAFHVELTPQSADARASVAEVQVHIVHTMQPNGPDCSPTCRSREGRTTLHTNQSPH